MGSLGPMAQLVCFPVHIAAPIIWFRIMICLEVISSDVPFGPRAALQSATMQPTQSPRLLLMHE
jgi:hypothetical protein